MTTIAQLQQTWQKTWHQFDVNGNAELYALICVCYAEPHRSYHTMQHLYECFAHFAQIRQDAEHPAEVELAIWFHDSIYQPVRKDNEEKSAAWGRASVIAQGLSEEIGDRIYSLIMATKHDGVPSNRDAEVLVDVDLGIFAADRERFDEYERQVRMEYDWVAEPVYRRERYKILQALLERSPLYSTRLFQADYEPKALKNLDRSLEKLNSLHVSCLSTCEIREE
jgi:predicted metal-dependent HD superfamily phosphohydrolase